MSGREEGECKFVAVESKRKGEINQSICACKQREGLCTFVALQVAGERKIDQGDHHEKGRGGQRGEVSRRKGEGSREWVRSVFLFLRKYVMVILKETIVSLLIHPFN